MFFGDIMFGFVNIFIVIVFLIVFGSILVAIISGIKKNAQNNAAPVLIVPAQVVSKRTEVRGDHSYTWYYSTFEVESGDRMEFSMSGEEYGLLAEQDLGLLTFQGTRYKSFKRHR
ncbi:DUF2500 domain-containing protein [Ureibacillus sp. NPDC094379]